MSNQQQEHVPAERFAALLAAEQECDQLRAENASLRESHGAIYVALGTHEADHTQWPGQIAKSREALERIAASSDGWGCIEIAKRAIRR